jgi:hypothetical protein
MKKKSRSFGLLILFCFCIVLVLDGQLELILPPRDSKYQKKFEYIGEKNLEIEEESSLLDQQHPNKTKKGKNVDPLILSALKKDLENCSADFEATFGGFMEGEEKLLIDDFQANRILEEFERFDFKEKEFKKVHKLGEVNISHCSAQERVVFVTELLSKNSIENWSEKTLDRTRISLTNLLLKTVQLPGSLQEFENLMVQIEIMSDQNLFGGIYKKEIGQVRAEFEKMKEQFEIRTFLLSEKVVKNKKSLNLESGTFKEKLKEFCKMVINDFSSS